MRSHPTTSNTTISPYHLRATTASVRKPRPATAPQQPRASKPSLIRSTTKRMFKPVVGASSMNLRNKPHPRYYHHQQQQQPPPQQQQARFYPVTSPIKISGGFGRMPPQQPAPQQFGYQRQFSHPARRSGPPSEAAGPRNFMPMNSNSFLSFSNSPGPQQQQPPQARYKAHFRSTPTKGKSKMLSAPYNTTQYIMYDYSKRKTSSGDNAQKEQFERDWDMQMQMSTDEELKEQFEQPTKRAADDSSSLAAAPSHSESDLEMASESEHRRPAQPQDINRLSTSI